MRERHNFYESKEKSEKDQLGYLKNKLIKKASTKFNEMMLHICATISIIYSMIRQNEHT